MLDGRRLRSRTAGRRLLLGLLDFLLLAGIRAYVSHLSYPPDSHVQILTALIGHIRSPERQVVTEKLHDEGRVPNGQCQRSSNPFRCR